MEEDFGQWPGHCRLLIILLGTETSIITIVSPLGASVSLVVKKEQEGKLTLENPH